ncbi:NAD(P)-dependent alcohol dehydrogenase [Microbacterium sp. YMB-B2]|uniref:NAD(P)-dependent alcohol dehydrogenase n=1 Tax=Microbacterium tenebrionis TaxID=2830665 RepID=A0A9X1LPQ8_9MICO|nr:NAD(P)-dependent alcohol dehydrogenase [Microbacterium tenebrionis]MCC2029674.1 NAD(P)-dependent alcohol dehydrogenase [Microbacterium tenebrionis]
MKVKAAVATEVKQPLTIQDIELDEPRANEVQVRMVASGVCHTDAVLRDGWIPTTMPIVLGHEGSGIIEKVGAAVTHLAPGDHVVLSVNSCGVCSACLSGHPAYCANLYASNFAGSRPDGTTAFSAADGSPISSHFFGQSSFASVTNVSVRSVVKVDSEIPLALLGPLGCGIQTGAGAVLNVLKPSTADSLVVFGTGAVGMSAIMAAAASRVHTIIAVDIIPSRLDAAIGFGATHTINGKEEDAVARIQEITRGGANFAIDTTGNKFVFKQMIDALAMSGRAGAIGASAPGSEGIIDMPSALARGISITWIVEGDAIPQTFIPELIALHQAGDFPFDKMIKTYNFDDINIAFEDSENGTVLKPVITF